MVTKYKKRLGAMHYGNYSESYMEQALKALREKRMSYRRASEVYNIPISTLCNKIKGTHPLTPGGLTALSKDEELSLSLGIQKATEWGFLTRMDIRLMVR